MVTKKTTDRINKENEDRRVAADKWLKKAVKFEEEGKDKKTVNRALNMAARIENEIQ